MTAGQPPMDEAAAGLNDADRAEIVAEALGVVRPVGQRDPGVAFSAPEQLARQEERYREGNGTFYRSLPFSATGNLWFVLVGGPMHYIDRRGEHSCVSSDATSFADNDVSRVTALVDDAKWTTAAVELVDRLVRIEERVNHRAYSMSLGFVNTPYRESVKRLAGRYPRKHVWGQHQPLQKPRRGRWLYDSRPPSFVFNCVRHDDLIPLGQAPTVALWRWPDRSDLMLHAFCETVSGRGSHQVTMILPDIPAFRDFARRYNRHERMTSVRRALLEQQLYFGLDKPNKRGAVVYSRFSPRLAIGPDGTEWEGTLLTCALSYLERHYSLRLTPYELMRDPLLRQRLEAELADVEQEPAADAVWTADEIAERERMLAWYRPEHENPGAFDSLFLGMPDGPWRS